MFERIAREMDGAEIQYPVRTGRRLTNTSGLLTHFPLILQVGIVLFVAYILFGESSPPNGSVICYQTGRIFTPEDCVVYSGPDIKIPDDI
jgi:hypothetical protein